MQRILVCLVLAIPAVAPIQLLAVPRWCVTNHPDALMCEDWDRYCNAMLNDPVEACPEGTSNGEAYWLANAVWKSGGSGCTSLSVEDQYVSSQPFSGRMNSSGDLGISYLPLGPFITKKFGTGYTQMMATDTAPIVLETVIDGAQNKILLANIYLELSAAIKQPLTDYILSDDCRAKCSGGTTDQSIFPVICRQSPAPSTSSGVCPPIATAPILPSIAAGAVAFTDPNSCHCESTGSDKFPHGDHLCVFDGKQWWRLSSAMFPGTFPGEGDFKLYARPNLTVPGINHLRMTINSSEIFVELMKVGPTNPQQEYSWCRIPRQYMGPFAVLNFGYAEPCKLKSNSWECAAIRQCVMNKDGFTTSMDNMLVSGGIGYDAPGACCVTDAVARTITCVQANGGMDCEQNYGGTFKGPNTACETTPCCPSFMPDHDMDGDVDLEDFGWFQTCLSEAAFTDPPTVSCKCANLDGDADVDTVDFGVFATCLSGPGITANPDCMN